MAGEIVTENLRFARGVRWFVVGLTGLVFVGSVVPALRYLLAACLSWGFLVRVPEALIWDWVEFFGGSGFKVAEVAGAVLVLRAVSWPRFVRLMRNASAFTAGLVLVAVAWNLSWVLVFPMSRLGSFYILSQPAGDPSQLAILYVPMYVLSIVEIVLGVAGALLALTSINWRRIRQNLQAVVS